MNQALKPVKWYKSLSSIKGRAQAGFFLVEGEKAIRQVIDADPEAVAEILASENLEVSGRYPVRLLTRRQLDQISAATTPQGIIAVVKLPSGVYGSRLPARPGPKILLLEDVQDPGNAGTLIRTAAAFGFTGILMSPGCADPFSAKCIQSSVGSLLSLWIRRTGSWIILAQELTAEGYKLVAASLAGSHDTSPLQSEKLILALGNEAAGLSSSVLEIVSHLVTIPIDRARAESLNVAISGAIIMYLARNFQI